MEGKSVTGPLVGGPEPSRHSSHVDTNERIPVPPYRILQRLKGDYLGLGSKRESCLPRA